MAAAPEHPRRRFRRVAILGTQWLLSYNEDDTSAMSAIRDGHADMVTWIFSLKQPQYAKP